MASKAEAKNVEKIAEIFYNEVHLSFNRLIEEFSSERLEEIKNKFSEITSDPAIDIIEKIAGTDGVPRKDRIAALTRVYEAAARLASELEQPELSKVFWNERPMSARNADPFQWVKDNYPSYGKGLHQGHIHHHDKSLYRRLHDSKPWPEDFDLPTRAQANDEILERIGRAPTLREIADAAPPNIREMIRHYELARSRNRKKAPRETSIRSASQSLQGVEPRSS